MITGLNTCCMEKIWYHQQNRCGLIPTCWIVGIWLTKPSKHTSVITMLEKWNMEMEYGSIGSIEGGEYSSVGLVAICVHLWCRANSSLTWHHLTRYSCELMNSLRQSSQSVQLSLSSHYCIRRRPQATRCENWANRWARVRQMLWDWKEKVSVLSMMLFEMAFTVCEFHITSHLLFWASGGGATNSPSHVVYMGISYSH